MDVKELNQSDLHDISGGEMTEDENGNIIFQNRCTTCGKAWEYKLEKGKDCFPDWATGPWCPECLKKQQEEFFRKSKQKNNT